jgi:hypothetical protein
LPSDRGFVTALKHLVRANVLAMRAIVGAFIQGESSEFFHANEPAALVAAEPRNARRFLSLDLNYGRPLEQDMLAYVMENGITRDEYRFFLEQNLRRHCVMGSDYYRSDEHHIDPNGNIRPASELFGYALIVREYYDRYRLPVMHIETNCDEGATGREARDWPHKQWAFVRSLGRAGAPVLGFTWYSLTDQIDWDVELRVQRGRVNPRGLFDLEHRMRPVGQAYQQLIAQWRPVLAAWLRLRPGAAGPVLSAACGSPRRCWSSRARPTSPSSSPCCRYRCWPAPRAAGPPADS